MQIFETRNSTVYTLEYFKQTAYVGSTSVFRKHRNILLVLILKTERRLVMLDCFTYTMIPRLTKIIRSGITFVSRNLR